MYIPACPEDSVNIKDHKMLGVYTHDDVALLWQQNGDEMMMMMTTGC